MCIDKLLSVIIFCHHVRAKKRYKFIIVPVSSNQITCIYKIFIVSAKEKLKLGGGTFPSLNLFDQNYIHILFLQLLFHLVQYYLFSHLVEFHQPL